MENYTKVGNVFYRVDGTTIPLTNVAMGAGTQVFESQENGRLYVLTGHANINVYTKTPTRN